MRIDKVRIKNFRSFRDVEVNFSPYTSLVGANGAGKSTVLCALNVFFRETENVATNMNDLEAEDFHARNTDEPIEITVTFSELNEEAKKDFAAYYRQGLLIIKAEAVFDKNSKTAIVRQFGQRMVMAEFSSFFELEKAGKLVAELKVEYEAIRSKFLELPKPGTKDAMREALRTYEEAHPEKCTLTSSPDNFYGFSKGANLLSRYVQWVYVPAVKDATKENVEAKNTALGKILARTVRAKVNFEDDLQKLRNETLTQYQKIIDAQQGALDDISKTLSSRLAQWAHPDVTARLKWAEDARKIQVDEPVARLIAGDGNFEGELARFGHGLQRSYLLVLLQELAASNDEHAPRLILGCEEPELYQHPPQARHLSSVFQELSEGNSQIIVSTHSPYFISGNGFESVRMVRHDSAKKHSRATQATFDRISKRVAEVTGETLTPTPAQQARLQQALQPNLNEMFFTPKLILVEGLEDHAYITSWIILSGLSDAFRRHGCHIVAANGKSYLIEPIIIAQELGIPVFAVFDADGNKTNANERKSHERDNKALLKLLGGKDTDPFPAATAWGNNYVQWPNNITDTLKSEIGGTVWDKTFGEATKGLGSPEGSYMKNPLHIGNHLELLSSKATKIPSLDQLCLSIIKFAQN